MSLAWHFNFNWNGDGSTMVDEASRVIDMHSKRGRDAYLRVDGDGNGIGYERVQPGTCSVVVLNTDGRFDPYNTSSPLYPYILPGRLAQIVIGGEYSGKGASVTKGIWHLNGNALDASGNANHGTPSNIAYVTGKFGQGATWTADNSFITLPVATLGALGTGDFAMSTWGYFVDPGAGNNPWIMFSYNTADMSGPQVIFDPYGIQTGNNRIIARVSSTNHWASTSASSLYGGWHNIIFTRIAGQCTFYVDATNVLTYYDNTSITTPNQIKINGKNNAATCWKSGMIGDEYIWENVGWTQAMVTDYYNSQTIVPVFSGRISIPRPTSGDLSTCTIEIVDGTDVLNKQDANIDVSANVRIDTAIAQILTAIAWPAIWGSSLEVATDSLPYWWADSKAAQEIADLADADLGWFFVAADGKATFFDRYHAGTALTTITQDMLGKMIFLPQPWDVVRNRVAVVAHPLTIGSAGSELWRMADVPAIAAGETKTYLVNYTYNNFAAAAYPAVVPVATTDFLVNANPDGSGADLTASCTASLTSLGTQGVLTITNSSASAGYITLAKVRGTPIYSLNKVTVQKDNAASQSLYQVRLLTIDSRWQENAYKAEDQANWLKNFLGNPLAFPQITVENRPDIQFPPDLFSLQPLAINQLGINGNYYVSSIEHKWLTPNGQAVLTKFGLEPAPDLSGYWRFTTQIGVTSRFGM